MFVLLKSTTAYSISFHIVWVAHACLKQSWRKKYDILEELCDVLPATLGPHPRVCVVVKCGSHHMLLNLNSILLTLITVVMRHVEPNKESKSKKKFRYHKTLKTTNINKRSTEDWLCLSFLFLVIILLVAVYVMQMHSSVRLFVRAKRKIASITVMNAMLLLAGT